MRASWPTVADLLPRAGGQGRVEAVEDGVHVRRRVGGRPPVVAGLTAVVVEVDAPIVRLAEEPQQPLRVVPEDITVAAERGRTTHDQAEPGAMARRDERHVVPGGQGVACGPRCMEQPLPV